MPLVLKPFDKETDLMEQVLADILMISTVKEHELLVVPEATLQLDQRSLSFSRARSITE